MADSDPHSPNVTEARQGETSNHMRWGLPASFLPGAATYFTRWDASAT